MTQFKDVMKLPFIEVTLRLYDVDVPYEDDGNGRRTYFTTFQYSGCEVSVNGEEIGNITSPMCGGAFVRLDGHRYFLPPDDLFYAVADAIGFEIPEEIEVEQPEEELDGTEGQDRESYRDTQDRENYIVDEEWEEEDEEEQVGVYFPPDWTEAPGRHIGGHLKDIPEPHVYYWPGADIKRKMTCRIMRFYGAGGRHYHVSVMQEDNPVWDGRECKYRPGEPQGWTVPWDRDFPGKGGTAWDLFRNEEVKSIYRVRLQARQDIEAAVTKYYPDHELVWDDYTDDEEGMYYADKHGE
jgi:hypothetical protein